MKTQWTRSLLVMLFFVMGNAIGAAQEEASNTTPGQELSVTHDAASRDALFSRWRQKNQELNRKLLEPTEIEFFETPLEEVAEHLAHQLGIEILIDGTALETLGLDRSLPITQRLNDVPLRAALDAMLSQHELTFYTQDGILFITSQEEAENKLIHRVYNVHSLVNTNAPLESMEAVRKLVTSIVGPDTWQEVGGPATMVAYQMTLVVSQTERNHESIEYLLRELDQVVAAAGGPKFPVAAKTKTAEIGWRKDRSTD